MRREVVTVCVGGDERDAGHELTQIHRKELREPDGGGRLRGRWRWERWGRVRGKKIGDSMKHGKYKERTARRLSG